jgi:formylglycine-generating enzyme required for sulfatase activity
MKGFRYISILIFFLLIWSCKTAPPPPEPVVSLPAPPKNPALPVPDTSSPSPSPPAVITFIEPPVLSLEDPESRKTLKTPEMTLRAELISGDAPVIIQIEGAGKTGFTDPFYSGELEVSGDGPYTITLDKSGISGWILNGNTYSFRIRGGTEGRNQENPLWGPWSSSFSIQLDLPAAPPEPGYPSEGTVTFDYSPVLTWDVSGEPDACELELAIPEENFRASGERGPGSKSADLPEQLLPDKTYRWRIRCRYGPLITRWSGWKTFRVTSRNHLKQEYFKRNTTVLSRSPGFRFTASPDGIAAYRFTLREAESGETVTGGDERADSFFPVKAELPEDRRYSVYGQYRNDDGIWCGEEELITFTVEPLEIPMAEVIPPEETAVFTMGWQGAWPDEYPVHQVNLTQPYELGVYELTNSQAAVLINWAVENGHAEIRETGVYETYFGKPLLGLGVMNYGTQFGLTGEPDRVVPVPDREDHPAVGITWYGAAAICNILSINSGYDPVYSIEDWSWNKSAGGYRLPTEAEWEYAARNGSSRLFPWGNYPSPRTANYYRSFDRWEDPAEPYTRNGGPTAPAGSFPNASRFGIFDLFGNVWEWCWDLYDPGAYSENADGVSDPAGPREPPPLVNIPGTEGLRVTRSCAWNTPSADFRSTNRGRYKPEGMSFSTGMRPARNLP